MKDFILKAPVTVIEKIWKYSEPETRLAFLKAYSSDAALPHNPSCAPHDDETWLEDGQDCDWYRSKSVQLLCEKHPLPDSIIEHLTTPKET